MTERKLIFLPAWDKTDPDPKKDYGVSCLLMFFQVVGEKGVVEFELLTNWFQEHVMERRMEALKHDVWMGKKNFLIRHWVEPFPADICYFSPVRLSEDDTFLEDGSYHVPALGDCYYGYKFTDEKYDKMAKDVAFRKLVDEGDESLWTYLEEYYREVFG